MGMPSGHRREKKSLCWLWILLSILVAAAMIGGSLYYFWDRIFPKDSGNGSSSTSSGTKHSRNASSTSGSTSPVRRPRKPSKTFQDLSQITKAPRYQPTQQ